MQFSQEQQFNQALIQLAVLFYQADGKITLSEQDYLDEVLNSVNWQSPISLDAFVNDTIHKTREALDLREGARLLRSLQSDLTFDAEKALEVAMRMSGVDGERSEDETELLSLLTHKVLARELTANVLSESA